MCNSVVFFFLFLLHLSWLNWGELRGKWPFKLGWAAGLDVWWPLFFGIFIIHILLAFNVQSERKMCNFKIPISLLKIISKNLFFLASYILPWSNHAKCEHFSNQLFLFICALLSEVYYQFTNFLTLWVGLNQSFI